MRTKTIIAMTVLLVCTLALTAQEPKMSAEQKAAMEAMEKAGKPGDNHKMLNGFIGNWNTVVTFWPAPGAPAMSSKGTSKNSWILGGRYVEQRFKGKAMGAAFEGIGYTGYDNIKKQYFGTWMDSMSTGMMMTTGTAADAGKNWTFKGTMDDPASGQAVPIEEKITIVNKDKHIFEMWNPTPQGQMYKSMEIVYTRAKK